MARTARERVTSKLDALRAEVLGLSDASLETLLRANALDAMIVAVRQVGMAQMLGRVSVADVCRVLFNQLGKRINR